MKDAQSFLDKLQKDVEKPTTSYTYQPAKVKPLIEVVCWPNPYEKLSDDEKQLACSILDHYAE